MSQMIKISFEWFTVHESQSTLKKKNWTLEQYSVHYISSYYLTSSQNLLTVWNCYFLKYTQEYYTKNVFIHLMLDNTSENISDFSNFHFFYSLLLLFFTVFSTQIWQFHKFYHRSRCNIHLVDLGWWGNSSR